jgi:hypothetical protein
MERKAAALHADGRKRADSFRHIGGAGSFDVYEHRPPTPLIRLAKPEIIRLLGTPVPHGHRVRVRLGREKGR